MDNNPKKKFWQNHIEACGKSGLSQVEYCQARKIPLSTFGYWKRKLNQSDKTKPVFYPIAISPDHVRYDNEKTTGLILHLKDGRFSLEIENGFSTSTLARVVSTLEKL
ncbi:MAG: hypothetical protein V2I36_19315 [Desulfopila sp.]|jgi:hypothetical protein|nr:hypothetical protein [Desulfopila sp.]